MYSAQTVLETGKAAVDEADSATGLLSLLIETDGKGEVIVVKRLSLPARVPFGASEGNFAIGAGQIVTQGQIVSRSRLVDERRREREGKDNDVAESRTRQASGTDTGSLRAAGDGSSGSASGTAKMMSASPVGNFYIYSFDGKLLQLYNVYGTLLKDYIYMGDRLIAEYDHVGSRFLYYTPDQINSTRVITDQGGNVVYAEAHDPYGGIQKTWVNTFDPKRKFSDKERDAESGLDYFGARYYPAPIRWADGHASGKYRWLTVDPILDTDKATAETQRWNLYSFCGNRPISVIDPDGRSILTTFGISLAISQAGQFAGFWMSFRLALMNQFDEWAGTPWDYTLDAIKGIKTDCGGLVHGVYKDAGYWYPRKGPNLSPGINFDLAVQEGGELENFFRKLGRTERLFFGDIVLWNGKHMAIYAGQKSGQDTVFTTTGAGAKIQEMRYMNQSEKSEPTGSYRWLFH